MTLLPSQSKLERIRLAVFAKAPVPGYAKTRLIPRLGAAGAARLHAQLVQRTLSTLCSIAAAEVTLWCAPDCSDPFFAECAQTFAVPLVEQSPGDIGARMHAAFVAQAAAQAPLLLVGTDCPVLAAHHILAAHAALREGNAAVFIPTEDGGYALIGLQQPQAALFTAMPWSTPAVMEETRRRLTSQGLRWRELETLWDLDEPRDYERWSKHPDAQSQSKA